MEALVGIELFIKEESIWKESEKKIAIDLLKLGPHVYEFMRDEWRLRLPPVAKVQNWINIIKKSEN